MKNISHFDVKINYIRYVPKETHCQICGTLGKYHSTGQRTIIDIDLAQPLVVFAYIGVYECNVCDKYFRVDLPFVKKAARYSNRAKQKVITSRVEDRMPYSLIPARTKRDFNIKPSLSTVHSWCNAEFAKIDLTKDYQPWVIASFSGICCIDEVYDKEFCIIFATDPVKDKTIAYEISESGTKQQMRRFMKYLKSIGIDPDIVITDGSNLYPENIKYVWKRARQQLCIFHVTQKITKDVQDAVREYKNSLPKPPKMKRGRPKKNVSKPKKKPNPRAIIFKNRYLFTTREENLTPKDKKLLQRLLKRHRPLRIIRSFMLEFYNLFIRSQTKEEAWAKQKAITQNKKYLKNKHLKRAIKRIQNKAKFAKMITYLDYDDLDMTTNHVERTNRRFRKMQKTSYRLRTKTTIDNMLKADLIQQIAKETVNFDRAIEPELELMYQVA